MLFFFSKAKFWLLLALVLCAALWLGKGQNNPILAASTDFQTVPLFKETTPARNAVKLVVMSDARQIVGWLSGPYDFAGQQASITINGQAKKVAFQKGNLFRWNYKVGKPTWARVEFKQFAQGLTLTPQNSLQPTAFFITDRSVFMPGQKLQFAAYLKQLDENGTWQPIAKRNVTVRLTSWRKRNTLANLKLTSDAQGRIAGNYQWNQADLLDDYQLSIGGFLGTVQVTLAEFRKSKVRLEIKPQRENTTVKLKFAALDFQGQPVPDGKVRFTAQVVPVSRPTHDWKLRGADFAYANQQNETNYADFSQLPEDEALLAEADADFRPFTRAISLQKNASLPEAPVAQFEGDLDAKDGTAKHSIELRSQWLEGGYQLRVQGVLLDKNQHEENAVATLDLGDEKDALEVQLPGRYFAPGEKISLNAAAKNQNLRDVSLVVMRLSKGGQSDAPTYIANPYLDYTSSMRPYGYSAPTGRMAAFATHTGGVMRTHYFDGSPRLVQRSLTTAVPLSRGSGEVSLSEPGAYKFVALAHTTSGETLRGEAGCVVRDGGDAAALVINLDEEEFENNAITGTLHCRYANAKVLLTVRDGSGIKYAEPLTLSGTMARFNIPVPDDLGYGATLEAQYAQSDVQMFSASEFVRVVPAAKILDVKTTVAEQYEPGAKAKIEVQLNRAEATDLVVAVYDKSLLGVAPDRAKDPRPFYLADERGRSDAVRDLLRRRLAGATVAKLVRRARALLKANETQVGWKSSSDKQQLENLSAAFNRFSVPHHTGLMELATLLRLAGLSVQFSGAAYYYQDFPLLKYRDEPIAAFFEPNHPIKQMFNYTFSNDTLWLSPRFSGWGDYWGGQATFSLVNHLDGANFNFADEHIKWRRGTEVVDMAVDSVAPAMNSSYSASAQALYSQMPDAGTPFKLITLDNNLPVRTDFADVAYWKSLVQTDANGHATVEFKLPDSLTNWHVVVTAISPSMRVGMSKTSFRTFKPVMVWPMLPRTFTTGDTVRIYGTLHNYSTCAQDIEASIKVENGNVISPLKQTVRVAPNGSAPVYWNFQPGEAGFTQILMSAACGAGNDASLKRLPVVAAGISDAVTSSGFAKTGGSVALPPGVNLKTAQLEIAVAPSLIADLADTLDFLVDYPYGCMEQTMSRFVPAIKVAQTLDRLNIAHDGLRAKLPGCVRAGISRLLAMQTADGGWGWQAGGRAHEMMTPYALYGLLEAERAGYDIGNENAINRGLNRLQTFINNMGAAQSADRIYCISVYANRRPVKAEWWQFIEAQARQNKLSDYALALSLELAAHNGKTALANELAGKLHARAQKQDGLVWWRTAGFSQWGDDPFETTAVALKALVARDANDPQIPGILAYFAENKHGKRWNSTKDTAMIVFAQCDYLAKHGAQKGSGQIAVRVNDGVPRPLTLSDGVTAKLTIPSSDLKAGVNQVKFDGAGEGTLYRLVLSYRSEGRRVAANGRGLRVQRHFYLLNEKGGRVREINSGQTVPLGAYLESFVEIKNTANNAMNYVLVDNPRPSSCEIVPDNDHRFRSDGTQCALREDRATGVFYHHESTPNLIRDRCILRTEHSGDFVAPPAQVEMLYRSTVRGHSDSFQFKVAQS